MKGVGDELLVCDQDGVYLTSTNVPSAPTSRVQAKVWTLSQWQKMQNEWLLEHISEQCPSHRPKSQSRDPATVRPLQDFVNVLPRKAQLLSEISHKFFWQPCAFNVSATCSILPHVLS